MIYRSFAVVAGTPRFFLSMGSTDLPIDSGWSSLGARHADFPMEGVHPKVALDGTLLGTVGTEQVF